jgi:hypothetical protein
MSFSGALSLVADRPLPPGTAIAALPDTLVVNIVYARPSFPAQYGFRIGGRVLHIAVNAAQTVASVAGGLLAGEPQKALPGAVSLSFAKVPLERSRLLSAYEIPREAVIDAELSARVVTATDGDERIDFRYGAGDRVAELCDALRALHDAPHCRFMTTDQRPIDEMRAIAGATIELVPVLQMEPNHELVLPWSATVGDATDKLSLTLREVELRVNGSRLQAEVRVWEVKGAISVERPQLPRKNTPLNIKGHDVLPGRVLRDVIDGNTPLDDLKAARRFASPASPSPPSPHPPPPFMPGEIGRQRSPAPPPANPVAPHPGNPPPLLRRNTPQPTPTAMPYSEQEYSFIDAETQKVSQIRFPPGKTIAQVKEEIGRRQRASANDITLLFAGKALRNPVRIENLGIGTTKIVVFVSGARKALLVSVI